MTDREKKYTLRLEKCRESIEKSKRLIEYHREMLKVLEKREAEILSEINKVKLSDLFKAINNGGYDIDELRQAVQLGDFSGMIPAQENINESAGFPEEKTEPIDRLNNQEDIKHQIEKE